MSIGKLAVLIVAVGVALAGIGAGFSEWRDSDAGSAIQLVDNVDARKNELDDDVRVADTDEDDGDRTRGNDGTGGGDNTGDGDRTRGNDGTGGGDNTGDGDWTGGNDGTGGGDNTGGVATPAGGGGGTGGGGTGGGTGGGGGSTG